MQTTTLWKPVQTTIKNSSKFTKKITHVDDMMIHNLVKYLIQTRLQLWDIKIINFKRESCPYDLLEICYFYISQTKSSLDKIFYKIVYYHIIYMCDFFWWIYTTLLPWFARFFSRSCGLHQIRSLTCMPSSALSQGLEKKTIKLLPPTWNKI